MNAQVKFISCADYTSTIKTLGGYEFHGSGFVEKQQQLFSVAPGVDLPDALNSVSDLLDMVRDAIRDAAMGGQPVQGNHAWLVLHALDGAQAVVDSLCEASAASAMANQHKDQG